MKTKFTKENKSIVLFISQNNHLRVSFVLQMVK